MPRDPFSTRLCGGQLCSLNASRRVIGEGARLLVAPWPLCPSLLCKLRIRKKCSSLGAFIKMKMREKALRTRPGTR